MKKAPEIGSELPCDNSWASESCWAERARLGLGS